MSIRQARPEDISRIAEMFVVNYRENFFPILKNEDFYFGELNVLDVAKDYSDNPENLANTYVYDDGVVKGMIRIKDKEIQKLFVEPAFQSDGIGSKLLSFATAEKHANFLWVLEHNKRGIAFYRRHGFDFTGDTVMENGWIPLKRMEKNN